MKRSITPRHDLICHLLAWCNEPFWKARRACKGVSCIVSPAKAAACGGGIMGNLVWFLGALGQALFLPLLRAAPPRLLRRSASAPSISCRLFPVPASRRPGRALPASARLEAAARLCHRRGRGRRTIALQPARAGRAPLAPFGQRFPEIKITQLLGRYDKDYSARINGEIAKPSGSASPIDQRFIKSAYRTGSTRRRR